MSDDNVVQLEIDPTMPTPVKEKKRKPRVKVERGQGKVKETVRAKKVAKAKKDVSAPCACQCGAMAKGGGFIPGHDSRLAGAMKRIINGKPYEGERAYVAKVIKSGHPALLSPHFEKLISALK